MPPKVVKRGAAAKKAKLSSKNTIQNQQQEPEPVKNHVADVETNNLAPEIVPNGLDVVKTVAVLAVRDAALRIAGSRSRDGAVARRYGMAESGAVSLSSRYSRDSVGAERFLVPLKLKSFEREKGGGGEE
ncbi:hypothetical protein L195_g043230 [Trifolium pratense]|uniref:Uncharacterized protein n=1 Tax=Trifolium pratense TaxID=57577 RepID=A0A2K3M8M8_TRIPR|nr:hypothetical protein L195_g043230 [Trifolium pratense]